MFSSVAVAVTPSRMFNSAVVEVTPSRMFNSAVVEVTPSRILSSAAVDVTPSNMFNSAAVDVTPSRMFNSAIVDVSVLKSLPLYTLAPIPECAVQYVYNKSGASCSRVTCVYAPALPGVPTAETPVLKAEPDACVPSEVVDSLRGCPALLESD